MNLGQFILIITSLTQGISTKQGFDEENQPEIKTCYAPSCATSDWKRVEIEVKNGANEKFEWCTLIPKKATPALAELIGGPLTTASEESQKRRSARISGKRLAELLRAQANDLYCKRKKRAQEHNSYGRGTHRYADR